MHRSIYSIHFVVLTSLNINNLLLRDSAIWFCCNEPDFPDLNPVYTKNFCLCSLPQYFGFFKIFFYFLHSHLTYRDRSHAVRHIHKTPHRRRFDLIISHPAVKGCQSKNSSVVRKRQLNNQCRSVSSQHQFIKSSVFPLNAWLIPVCEQICKTISHTLKEKHSVL